MARKNYSVDEVIRKLHKKNDVKVFNDGTIQVLSDTIIDKKGDKIPNPRKRNDLGNGSWGKISFLVNYKGYVVIKVETFTRV